MVLKFFHGVFIGIAFVLPGLSAGTVILILGFYRKFLEDIASLKLKPYFPHLAGAAFGALTGVFFIGFLMERHYSLLLALLLGMLVASVKVVINCNDKSSYKILPILMSLAGFAATWLLVGDPRAEFTPLPEGSLHSYLLGGILASSTMLLPGVSGSAVLIIFNLYDDLIMAVNNFQWLNLLFFGTGFLLGLIFLARLLSALYRRYCNSISFLLAGLILGSTRALIPPQITPGALIAALAGAALVFFFTGRARRC